MLKSNDHDEGFGDDGGVPDIYEEGLKLFVGQIPKDIDEKDLLPFFSEIGPVSEIRIIRDKSSQTHKGCAFLTYRTVQAALSAVEQLHDKVKLPNAINALQVRIAESQVERENKLFVGMLPKTLEETDLHQMFSQYGELKEVHVIRGPEGTSRGCAFIKFVERESAIVAIEDMHNVIPVGSSRPLVVKFAENKKGSLEKARIDAPPIQSYSMNMPVSKSSDFWIGHQHSAIMYPYVNAEMGVLQQQQQPQHYMQMAGGTYQYPNISSPQLMSVASDDRRNQQMLPPPRAGTDGNFPHGRGNEEDRRGGGPQLSSSLISTMAGIGPFLFDREAQGRAAYGPSFALDSSGQRDRSMSNATSRPPEGPSGANLFIYHLPRDLTDADLATLFAPFGNVISAKVFVDKKTSDSKGFGFVSYDAPSSADAAISSMNGFQIGSKRLKVQHKRTGGIGDIDTDHLLGGHHMMMPQHQQQSYFQPSYAVSQTHYEEYQHSQMQSLYSGMSSLSLAPSNNRADVGGVDMSKASSVLEAAASVGRTGARGGAGGQIGAPFASYPDRV